MQEIRIDNFFHWDRFFSQKDRFILRKETVPMRKKGGYYDKYKRKLFKFTR